jgi:hypothetical protein
VQESASKALLGRVASLEGHVSALRTAETELEAGVRTLETDSPAKSDMIATVERLQFTVRTLKEYAGALPSLIVWDFPELFEAFTQKQFTLLWRGSRDGFRAGDFHSRCNRHANTLTVILDTDGNIFGGFTPVKWESRKWNGKSGREDNCYKTDPSLKSFLFTLKNPHNLPPQSFALKGEKNVHAIRCDSECGPHFGDINVFDFCNTNNRNFTYRFGTTYINDTERNGAAFFTDSKFFQVKEIEVFEIS